MNPQNFCGKKHCFFVSPCWPLEYLGEGLLESVLEIYSCMWFLGQLKCQKLWFSPSKQYTKPKSQQFTVLNLSCISFFLVLSSLSFATSHPSNQLLAQTLLKPLKITITCLSAPAQCHPAQSSRNSWQMRNFPGSAAWVKVLSHGTAEYMRIFFTSTHPNSVPEIPELKEWLSLFE